MQESVLLLFIPLIIWLTYKALTCLMKFGIYVIIIASITVLGYCIMYNINPEETKAFNETVIKEMKNIVNSGVLNN